MKIQKACPHCHKIQVVHVDDNQYNDWLAGKNIQIAFPNLSADEREILMSGICPDCWEEIFGNDNEDEDLFDMYKEYDMYNGPTPNQPSEYDEFGTDSRTGEPFNYPSYS